MIILVGCLLSLKPLEWHLEKILYSVFFGVRADGSRINKVKPGLTSRAYRIHSLVCMRALVNVTLR